MRERYHSLKGMYERRDRWLRGLSTCGDLDDKASWSNLAAIERQRIAVAELLLARLASGDLRLDMQGHELDFGSDEEFACWAVCGRLFSAPELNRFQAAVQEGNGAVLGTTGSRRCKRCSCRGLVIRVNGGTIAVNGKCAGHVED